MESSKKAIVIELMAELLYMSKFQRPGMAILAIVTGQGLTKQMYDELRKEVDWEHNRPTGIIFHAAGFDNSGNLRVADIWESEQDLNNFFNNVLKPAAEKINAPMPKGEIFPIHSVSTWGVDDYKVK